MENAKKAMQKAKFDDVRVRGHANPSSLHGTEAQIYAGASTIYNIGRAYANDDDRVFADFQHVTDITDTSLSMGHSFKGAGFDAGRQADAIKNSQDYARAKANAQRAEQNKK